MEFLLAVACLAADESALREEFARAFRDPAPERRAEAVRKLAGSREEGTLGLLAGALRDPSKEVRRAAAEALEACRDEGGVAIKPLCAVLVDKEEDPDVRYACAKALSKARYKYEPIEALIRTISSITPQERHLFSFGARVTDVLNAMAGEDFGKERRTPELWQNWWEENRDRLKKEDEARRQEYRKGAGQEKKK